MTDMTIRLNTRFTTSPDSIRIAYDVSGAGTPIMLLHGGGGSRKEWHETGYVTRLMEDFTVIAVDLRGHGEICVGFLRIPFRKPKINRAARGSRASRVAEHTSSQQPRIRA